MNGDSTAQAPTGVAGPLAPSPAAATSEPAALGVYLLARFGALYAAEARLDAAIEERARALGVSLTAERLRLEEERGEAPSTLSQGRRPEGVATTGAPLPPGLAEEARARRAWRRAMVAEIIRAERPAPTDAELRASFDRTHGAGGVRRSYRHLLVSTDPGTPRTFGAAEPSIDAAGARAAAVRLARDVCAEVEAGRASLDGARARGGEVFPLGAIAARLGPDAMATVAAAPAGRLLVVEGREAVAVVRVDRRIVPAIVEAVKLAVLPRPGEERQALIERAEAARLALASAEDPALVPLSRSDDAADRRSGGRVVVATGGAERSVPNAAALLSADALPEALLDALGALEPGAVTPLVPWRKGYAAARLVSRRRVSGDVREEGQAALFDARPAAVRARALAPRIEALARERAEALRARVAAGEPIEGLALAESDDNLTRKAGGLLEMTHDPDLSRALAALPVGGPATIVRGRAGFHVVRCAGETRTRFDDVAAALRDASRSRPPAPEEIDRRLAELARPR